MSVVRSLHSDLDLVGFSIFAPALIMLLLALQWGGTTFAWNSSQIIGLFCGAGQQGGLLHTGNSLCCGLVVGWEWSYCYLLSKHPNGQVDWIPDPLRGWSWPRIANVLEISSQNMHLLSMVKVSLLLGLLDFEKIVSGTDLAGVLIAYAKSIDRIFYLAAGLGAGCFVFAWGMGWKDLRKKKEVSKA
ncbi:MAG: hypothetical protein Q9161_007939 [Pseudevernia consocians]